MDTLHTSVNTRDLFYTVRWTGWRQRDHKLTKTCGGKMNKVFISGNNKLSDASDSSVTRLQFWTEPPKRHLVVTECLLTAQAQRVTTGCKAETNEHRSLPIWKQWGQLLCAWRQPTCYGICRLFLPSFILRHHVSFSRSLQWSVNQCPTFHTHKNHASVWWAAYPG